MDVLRMFVSPGATVDSALNGVNAKPELFPGNLKEVPDINFFYRYATSDGGRVVGPES